MKKIFIAVTVAASFLTVACNNGSKDESKATETSQDTTSTTSSAPASTGPTVLELTANDQLKFDKIELRVKANEPVKLTLKNIGTMPKESMGHNFVLLKDGTDLAAFATSAISAPEHVPANNAAVVAHTKVLGPGESDTIEFTVPAGSYTYICSFPGHYMSMTGVLIAE